MDRLKKSVLVLHLTRKLRDRGSWCGETHLQKAMYFVQQAFGIEAGFEFTFYKHGPFSFDLRDFIGGLQADGLLRLEPQTPPYGPRFAPTEDAEDLENQFPKMLRQYGQCVEVVADFLGDKGVAELERLASALYVIKEGSSDEDVEARANEIRNLKPHVGQEAARVAIENVDSFLANVGT
jgi:uncharacterized protein YwgA